MHRKMNLLIWGHVLLILCCAFYLIWWGTAFRPGFEGSRVGGVEGILLILAALFGLAGMAVTIMGINVGERSIPPLLPTFVITIGGVVVYCVLLALTSLIMHRQVTTELLLIVGWLVLELCSVNAAYSAGIYGKTAAFLIMISAAVISAASLGFYLAYYRVKPFTGYIFGMIPLILIGICMGVNVICMKSMQTV